MKPYFYVYRNGTGYPIVKHETIQEAQKEAERLATKHPGITFEILACVGLASTVAPQASTFWMDGVNIADEPKEPKEPKWSFDWSKVPDGYDYATMDENGEWCCHRVTPSYFEDYWWSESTFHTFKHLPFPGYWKDSRQIRENVIEHPPAGAAGGIQNQTTN